MSYIHEIARENQYRTVIFTIFQSGLGTPKFQKPLKLFSLLTQSNKFIAHLLKYFQFAIDKLKNLLYNTTHNFNERKVNLMRFNKIHFTIKFNIKANKTESSPEIDWYT